jgi:uncharacterized repeat protein (TIGR02543 family)
MITRVRPCSFLLILFAITSSIGTSRTTALEVDQIIVYETYGYYGGPADIHAVDPDGQNDRNLTPNTEDSMELDPELSPDGTRIVFISNRVIETNPDGNFEIFTMATDGSDVTQVTNTEDEYGQGAIQSYNPTWSPDGLQVAFDGYRGLYEASEVYIIDVDGTDERRLTSNEDQANKWLPDWSPDGTKILYTWGWDYYTQDIRTINPDGSGETTLSDDAAYTAESGAVWSPDGTRIAYSGDGTIPGIYPNPNREIFVMEYPSLDITPVTEHAAVDESPAWSADGTQITFASSRDGRYALFVIAAPPVPLKSEHRGLDNVEIAAESPVRKLDPTTDQEGDPFWGTIGAATRHVLTVAKAGTGEGSVRSDIAGIVCGTDCSEAYVPGTVVKLKARAADGSVFTGWSGACAGTGATCTVTMDAAKSVTATFSVGHVLKVTRQGAGTVTSSPSGISCGADCSQRFAAGAVVNLSAVAKPGYKFSAWSGACSGTASTCAVTMSAKKTVTATFVRF